MTLNNLVLRNYHATPKNIIIEDLLNRIVFTSPTLRNIYMISGVVLGGGTGAEVYPIAQHVRAPDTYGPNGSDFTGTEVLPPEAKVELGWTYGGFEGEFEGTLNPGTGSSKRRIRFIE